MTSVLYWLNFFGRPYRDLIGREKLLSAPVAETREVDSGVLLRLAADPLKWGTPEYREAEASAFRRIGPEYFFSRHQPERKTVAPRFDLDDPRNPLHEA